MLDTLVSSKTKIKLLLKFFLNANNTAYLRNLETEFNESTNAIRIELNRFEESGLLNSYSERNKKIFKANTKHPLYPEINSIIRKYIGIDKIIDEIISRLGEPDKVWLVGNFARGLDSSTIDLKIKGTIDKSYLNTLIKKVENSITRKINITIIDSAEELLIENKIEPALLLWSRV
ncbi:MAG: ArsR family transcriptional regulator [Bacteroidetes bacterium]|nr:ArsR family transcriptional regulator [Bacteroidota bacterium]